MFPEPDSALACPGSGSFLRSDAMEQTKDGTRAAIYYIIGLILTGKADQRDIEKVTKAAIKFDLLDLWKSELLETHNILTGGGAN